MVTRKIPLSNPTFALLGLMAILIPAVNVVFPQSTDSICLITVLVCTGMIVFLNLIYLFVFFVHFSVSLVFHLYTLVTLYRYSYDYGMVHMIMLSTEHDYRPGSPQYQWLENDLKSVDRSKTPFVMIGGHRPMYCSEAIHCKLIFFCVSEFFIFRF